MAKKDEKKKSCFVICPIGSDGSEIRDHSDKVLRHILRKVLEPEYKVTRADEIEESGDITRQIMKGILIADLIIVDLTEHNPNVFYELAAADAFRKPTILMIGDGRRAPFDLKDRRAIPFVITDLDSVEQAKEKLATFEKKAAGEEAPETMISSVVNIIDLQRSSDPKERTDAQILDVVEGISSRLSRIERRTHSSQLLRAWSPPPEEDEPHWVSGFTGKFESVEGLIERAKTRTDVIECMRQADILWAEAPDGMSKQRAVHLQTRAGALWIEATNEPQWPE